MPVGDPEIEVGRPSDVLGHVLGVLARGADVATKNVDEILRGITETAARTLSVARVNIWLFDPDRERIRCLEGYDARTRIHESGELLEARDYPSYFSALELLRNIAAMDAEHDPRTSELTASYLRPHDISTMLDVPLLHSGRVIGVVCHEHVGPPRKWTEIDRLFAGSVGDLVALVLEAEQLAEVERQRALLNERILRAEQLESSSFLAASVAHDFRNLLTAVFAHSQILINQLPPGPLSQSARDIMDAATRSRDLCDKLLAYAGKKPNAPALIELGPIVEETARLLRARVPHQVKFSVDVARPLPKVRGDATELSRVVLNLLVNALDAVESRGGTVHVTLTEGKPAREGGSSGDFYDFRDSAGPSLLLQVSDDGVGMSADTRRSIFQPFFSTKRDGHGFGLSTVLGTVRGHGGALEVESALGRGTSFRIWFPCE
jgi:signal transduction histidine kinase